MHFAILGPLRVVDGDTEVDLGGPRQQRVLAALLASQPRQLTTDQLVDAVWGDDTPATASHVVHTYVSNLRAAVGDRISSDGRHYGIDTADDDVDATRFAALVEQADRDRVRDAGQALALLTEAETLWRGRPFGDLGDGSLLVERRASELEALHLRSIEMRIGAELDLGHHDRVIPELESLIVEHPYQEQLHRYLMMALYRSGRQADALRIGFTLRGQLVEDLGIEPSHETRALEDRILRQDVELDLTPPTTMPMFASSFVGRDLEIAEVVKRLDAHRLVTLVGVGGVGKTRLAVEGARRVLDRFRDGIWWVDLTPLDDGSAIALRVAEALGLADQPGIDPSELVHRFVARRTMVIVLDNCEHVVEDTRRFATEQLRGAAGLKILATSRRRLNAAGEHAYEVPSLSLPFGTLGASDAERLFMDRAADLDGSFRADDVLQDVARICVDLAGHPLAIEMAAGRIPIMSAGEIATRLADQLEFLTQPPGIESRHRGIEAAIQWSYDLLTETERAVFDRLSVFVAPFDVAAAEAVVGWDPVTTSDVFQALTTLIDSSMLATERQPDGSVRFRLLEMMKEFGRARLGAHGQRVQARHRHAEYHLGLVAASAEHAYTPQHQHAIAQLGSVSADVVAALDWALDNEPSLVTAKTVEGFVHYWFRVGEPGVAYEFGTRMLALDRPDPMFAAGAHLAFGFGAQLTGNPQATVESINTALTILESQDDWRLLLFAYSGQGAGGAMAGIPGLGAAMGSRILEVCDKHDLDLPRAYGLVLMGQEEFFHGGDLDVAEQRLEEAAPLLRGIGDETALNMFCLGVLAPVKAEMGDFEGAERTAAEASTYGGPGWSATPLIVLAGWVLIPRGDLERAEELLLSALERVHERSLEAWTRPALLMLARVATEQEHWERAARLYGGARVHLPQWAHRPTFWETEIRVRTALGDDAYERLAGEGAAEPLDDLVTRLLTNST